jgi:hypothetical protein
MKNWLRELFWIKTTARCRYCGGSDYKDFMVHKMGLGWFCNKIETEDYIKLRKR